jgi:hypothetical protein
MLDMPQSKQVAVFYLTFCVSYALDLDNIQYVYVFDAAYSSKG